MVKKYFCDRCKREIEIQSDSFNELFDGMSSSFGLEKEGQVTQPQLCKKCKKGYKKVIERYLREVYE